MDSDYQVSETSSSCWQRLKANCSRQNVFCGSLLTVLILLTAIYATILSRPSSTALDQTCIINLPTFEIQYGLWMKVYGYTNLFAITLTIILLMAIILKHNRCQTLNRTTKWFIVINLGFQSAWYVVDCIYFFNRNSESCGMHVPLYSFAVCMMFIHPIILSLSMTSLIHFTESDLYELGPYHNSYSQRLANEYVNTLV